MNSLKARATVEITETKELMAGVISGVLCYCDWKYTRLLIYIVQASIKQRKNARADL